MSEESLREALGGARRHHSMSFTVFATAPGVIRPSAVVAGISERADLETADYPEKDP